MKILIIFLIFSFCLEAATINQSFNSNPNWTSSNLPTGNNDYGYRTTSYAGGSAGEIGGNFARSYSNSYYADTNIGVLTRNDAVQASGKWNMVSIASDYNANTVFSHFDTSGFTSSGTNSIGIMFLEASSTSYRVVYRIGDSQDLLFTLSGLNQVRTWSYSYNPNIGYGQFVFTISGSGGGTQTVNLTQAQRNSIGNLNAFGFATFNNNGITGPISLFMDDLSYTTAIPVPEFSSFFLVIAGLVFFIKIR
ncbi:MAG: hypothetical protein HUU50_16425 [Candidatus Brocadiae bacterium]|nr:hypothetical protein [Candidatus Brocadiia bacterium]